MSCSNARHNVTIEYRYVLNRDIHGTLASKIYQMERIQTNVVTAYNSSHEAYELV
jgi:hypothetical protein